MFVTVFGKDGQGHSEITHSGETVNRKNSPLRERKCTQISGGRVCACVYAHTLLPYKGSLETVSRKVAAAIWEADSPCSVDSPLCRLSSLTFSPQSKTFVLLEMVRKFRMLQVSKTDEGCNINTSLVILACRTTSA